MTQAVRHILAKNRVYSQVLEMDIANLTALALRINSEVEMWVGSQVNTNTIVVAIKRLVDQYRARRALKKSSQPSPPLDEFRVSLTDSVVDINCDLLESQDMSAVLDQVFEGRSLV